MYLIEIILIIILSTIVLNAKDIKYIIKLIKNSIKWINNIKKELLLSLEEPIQEDDLHEEEQLLINHYLSKIISSGNQYNGPYELQSIKSYYLSLKK